LKTIKDIIKKLSYITNKKQKRQYVAVMLVAFIGSLWELIGVTAIMPFINAIMTPEELGGKWYYEIVMDVFHPSDSFEVITILAVFIVVIYIVKNAYLIFSSYLQSWYSTNIQKDLSIKLTNTYLRSSYLFHLGINSSVLIRTISSDVVGVFAVFFHIFRIVAEVFTIMVISLFIVLLDPILAISLIVVLGLCMLILMTSLKKRMKAYGKQGQLCEGQMLQYLTQAFSGIKEIMVMKRQEYFAENYSEVCTKNAKVGRMGNFLNAIPQYIYEAVCIGGLISIVTVRLYTVDDMTIYVTKLAAVALAAFRLFPSVGRLTTNLNAISYNKPRLDSIYEMIRDVESEEMYQLTKSSEKKGEELTFNNELKAEGITWRYPAGKEDVLSKLSINVNKGQSVALIGPSGAGKTTLADIILGLLKPQKGQIFLDGKDVYDNLVSWSKIVGYVPQAVYLTDDTIRNNVAFGIYKDKIDDEKIWKALENAQIADFVRSLDAGLDTMVGERGTRLSGGQRQRIAIARALYEDPQILVLDEATSALDNETETAVMEAVETLHGSKTMIIVAHRLTTIRNCDVIYEIKDGIAKVCNKEDVIK